MARKCSGKEFQKEGRGSRKKKQVFSGANKGKFAIKWLWERGAVEKKARKGGDPRKKPPGFGGG